MVGITVFGCFCLMSLFVFLGTKMTILHKKYFGENTVGELTYPIIFTMLYMSIIIEIAVRF